MKLGVDKVDVFITLNDDTIQVGQLNDIDGKIYFKYKRDFLDLNVNISPFKLKFNDKPQTADISFFEGLFGVFADSIPDGWGRRLMDKFITSQGYTLDQISALDRLCLVGQSGPGALTYIPTYNEGTQEYDLEIDEIYNDVISIQEELFPENIIKIWKSLGGNSVGARPKINVSRIEHEDRFSTRDILDSEKWIVKFPALYDDKDIGKIEYVYAHMAKLGNIEIAENRLLRTETGHSFFASKRFDRDKRLKIHMNSAAGMLHDNFRFSALDYGHLCDTILRLENDLSTIEKILRLAYFNLITSNQDDHSKNFSFILNNERKWKFAPAYDLTYSPSGTGYFSTSFDGESKNPTWKHIKSLAKIFGLNHVNHIKDEIEYATTQWQLLAQDVDIPKVKIDLISKSIISRVTSKIT